jgi:hypothetical protein
MTPWVGKKGNVAGTTNRILKFVVTSFGLNSVVLTEGSIMNPCLRSGSNLVNN